MAFEIDPDLYRSASYRNMAASLIAPLQTGAVDSEIALEGGNRIMLNRTVARTTPSDCAEGKSGSRRFTSDQHS